MNSAVENFECYDRWKRWSTEEFGQFGSADDLYFKAELARTGLDWSMSLRVLEIGFGNGVFAGWSRARGFVYKGTELSEELVQRGQRAGFDVHIATSGAALPTEPALWDLVVAFDVFEHCTLEALEATLANVKNALRPGGCLLARMPSGDSPFGRAILHGDITHQVALGSSAIRQLADLVGFEVVAIGSPSLPVLGLGARRGARRLFIKVARGLISKLINGLFHDNQDCVITPNVVFIWRKALNTD